MKPEPTENEFKWLPSKATSNFNLLLSSIILTLTLILVDVFVRPQTIHIYFCSRTISTQVEGIKREYLDTERT